jgi:hypothetical protein
MRHPSNILNSDELRPITIVCEFLHNLSGEITTCACDKDLGWGRDGDHEGWDSEESVKVRIASHRFLRIDCTTSSHSSFSRTSGVLVSVPSGFDL